MKLKLWLNIITFVVLGLIIYFAWPDIMQAFHKMQTLNIWVLLLIIPAQFFCVLCPGTGVFLLFSGDGR